METLLTPHYALILHFMNVLLFRHCESKIELSGFWALHIQFQGKTLTTWDVWKILTTKKNQCNNVDVLVTVKGRKVEDIFLKCWRLLVSDDLRVPCLRSRFLPGSSMKTNDHKWRQNGRLTIHGNTVWNWYVHKTTACVCERQCLPASGSPACRLSPICPVDGCPLRGDSGGGSGSASTPVSSATRRKIWK